jgi:hypothetical protein
MHLDYIGMYVNLHIIRWRQGDKSINLAHRRSTTYMHTYIWHGGGWKWAKIRNIIYVCMYVDTVHWTKSRVATMILIGMRQRQPNLFWERSWMFRIFHSSRYICTCMYIRVFNLKKIIFTISQNYDALAASDPGTLH